MRPLAEDTSPEAEQVLLKLLRQASPARKLEMIASANRASRELALCGLKMRFPNNSPAQLRRRLASLCLGEELAWKAYGPLPLDEPARH